MSTTRQIAHCSRVPPFLAVLALPALPAAAATITVTSTDVYNHDACGLKDAIKAANNNESQGDCPAGSGATRPANSP